ncbi:MAG TPA: hypothetical protein VIT00_03985 [Terrimicrobiaceae bacterium]
MRRRISGPELLRIGRLEARRITINGAALLTYAGELANLPKNALLDVRKMCAFACEFETPIASHVERMLERLDEKLDEIALPFK